MSRIFLLRHCEPDFPGGVRVAIGRRTEPALSLLGRVQAAVLTQCFEKKQGIVIYSSPMRRAVETAQAFGRAVKILPETIEMELGEWDGVSFEDVRRLWPEHYEKRGHDLSLPPPGGESYDAAAARMERALLSLPEEDCIVVAHDGVNRALICRLMGLSMRENRSFPQPYGAINVLERRGNSLAALAVGKSSDSIPDEAEIGELYALCETPERVQNHCKAVAELAREMGEKLNSKNNYVNLELLHSAALLHDLCRREKQHPAAAARVLESRGYIRLASIVEAHHDPENCRLDEAGLLYLADKLVQENRRVTIEERFAASAGKCRDEAAKMANLRRRETAQVLMKMYIEAVDITAGHKEEK